MAARQYPGIVVPLVIIVVVAKADAGVVSRHAFAHAPAEQLVKRDVVVLADNIPERDFDGGEGANFRPGVVHLQSC